MPQQLTALRVTSDEFFENSFSEREIAISTLQIMHYGLISVFLNGVFATHWGSDNNILNDRKVMTMILYVYKKTEI